MKVRCIFCLVFFLVLSPASASPEFSDSDAQRFLEQWYHEGCTRAVALGAVILQVGERDLNYPEEIRERATAAFSHTSAHITSYMYAMEERGIVDIERLWADASQKWQVARVTLTPRGEALRKRWPQGDAGENSLCVKWGTGRVTHVGRNEEVRKGLDIYRIVMVVSEWKYTPEMLLLDELRGDSVSDRRKAIVLLRYDPFQSKWERVAFDVANLDDDFKTSNVTKELEKR